MRVIRLPQIVIDLYEKYKAEEIAAKRYMGIRHTDDDYLFCDITCTKILYYGNPY